MQEGTVFLKQQNTQLSKNSKQHQQQQTVTDSTQIAKTHVFLEKL